MCIYTLFMPPSQRSGGILFLPCLCLRFPVCPHNFNLGYNFWSIKDNVFKLGIWTPWVKFYCTWPLFVPKLYKTGLFELWKYKSYHSREVYSPLQLSSFSEWCRIPEVLSQRSSCWPISDELRRSRSFPILFLDRYNSYYTLYGKTRLFPGVFRMSDYCGDSESKHVVQTYLGMSAPCLFGHT